MNELRLITRLDQEQRGKADRIMRVALVCEQLCHCLCE